MITSLNKENFEEEVLKSKGLTFVKFSAKTGCGYCTEFSPKYEIAELNGGAKFCAYERESLRGTPLDDIETKYGITGFPTVIAFQDGELKGKMPTYKFISDRELKGLILDEQKKLLNQENYVEDLTNEFRLRTQPRQSVPNNCMAECEANCGVDAQCKRDCVAHCNPEAREALEEHLKAVK